MGRKKKIELLEKPEPSRSLPNHEFERRKWEAYNDLREGMSYRKAAAQHKISYRCLFDYARGKKNRVESHERYMALPVELENQLSIRISAIVQESGVFPQQKVISQLANDLIRQNESSNAGQAGPSSEPSSTSPSSATNTESSSTPSSSSSSAPNAATESSKSPISPKPAVSDTWVSKFLRRHPELKYERRGKKRKLEPPPQPIIKQHPALTPVIINTQFSHPNVPFRQISTHPNQPPSYASQVPALPPPVPSESHPYQPHQSTPGSPALYSQQHQSHLQQSQQHHQHQQPQLSPIQPLPQPYQSYEHRNFPAPNIPHSVTSAPASVGSETANLATYSPKLTEDDNEYKCLNQWYGALNAIMDTFSIQPSNVYNACCLNLTVDDERGCILSRNIAARVSSTHSAANGAAFTTSSYSTVPFITDNAYGLSVFECICSDGSSLPPAVISPVALESTHYSVLKASVDRSQCSSRIPRVARSNFFMWLKRHFELHTRAKADGGKEWRVLITEETPSIDLFFFLWAFLHRILVVVIPARLANATQPLDKGDIIHNLRNKLVSSLTMLMSTQYNIETNSETVLVGSSPEDIGRRNSAPTKTSHDYSFAKTGLVTTIYPPAQFSLSKKLGIVQLMDIYMGARSLTEGIQEAWKGSGIVPRNPVLVMNCIDQIPGIEPETYLLKFNQPPRSGPLLSTATPPNLLFPSVSTLEKGFEIYHHDELDGNEKAAFLFQLLESSFDRAIGRDLSLRRKTNGSEGIGGLGNNGSGGHDDYYHDYDYDYDYEEAEQVLGYERELMRDTQTSQPCIIKQEQGASSPLLALEPDAGSGTAGAIGGGGASGSKLDMVFSMPSNSDLSVKLRQYLHPSRIRSKASPMTIDQVTIMMKSSGFTV